MLRTSVAWCGVVARLLATLATANEASAKEENSAKPQRSNGGASKPYLQTLDTATGGPPGEMRWSLINTRLSENPLEYPLRVP